MRVTTRSPKARLETPGDNDVVLVVDMFGREMNDRKSSKHLSPTRDLSPLTQPELKSVFRPRTGGGNTAWGNTFGTMSSRKSAKLNKKNHPETICSMLSDTEFLKIRQR